jgi:hypothetical protein
MTEPVYYKGDVVELHADLFPGFVKPLPPGVPTNVAKKRVVVTERCLTIAWSIAGVVQRLDLPMTKEETAEVTFRGGMVGEYEVGRDSGCSTCGAGAIKNWRPWPGVTMKQTPRLDVAAAAVKNDANFGLPSGRYSRSRP